MTRKDDRELLEVLHFCIACCLHVYPPFRRIALPHVLGCLQNVDLLDGIRDEFWCVPARLRCCSVASFREWVIDVWFQAVLKFFAIRQIVEELAHPESPRPVQIRGAVPIKELHKCRWPRRGLEHVHQLPSFDVQSSKSVGLGARRASRCKGVFHFLLVFGAHAVGQSSQFYQRRAMHGFLGGHRSGSVDSFLAVAACCMQASLFDLVNAFASFLDQFQVLLESDHEINGVMGIAPLRTNQEFRRQVQGQHRRVDSLSCSIWAVLCSNGAVIVGGVL